MKTILFKTIVLGFLCVLPLVAQEPDAAVQLRLAQSFEQAGDWERAVSVYESLFFSDPKNYVYFESLRRGYTQLKLYDKAVELIHYRLGITQNDPILLSSLGGVFFLKGEEQKADSIWQSIIEKDRRNPGLYRLVASKMMEYRLYDRAIKTFLAAREMTGNRKLFTDELASLYNAFQLYEEAMSEYVSMLESSPQQLLNVQSQISGFIVRPEALKAAHRVIQQEVDRRKEFVPLRQLYAWILMEEKEYGSALEEYREIDRLKNASGKELFNFGQRAATEEQYRVAAEAFAEVLRNRPQGAIVPMARFGYARALEEASAATDTAHIVQPNRTQPGDPVSEVYPSFGKTLQLYEDIIRDYPGSEFAAQSVYRIGVIKRDRFFDLDGALAAFERVITLLPGLPLAVEANLRIAEALTSKNSITEAKDRYSVLLQSGDPDIRARVLFKIAELEYFEAGFDSAAAKLQTFSENSGTDLANDALQLMYFIQENKSTAPGALSEFARADLLERQRKYSEALARFQNIVLQYPEALLIDDALLKIAGLQLRLQRPQEALNAYETIIKDLPMSILRDRAQMGIGRIYEREIRNIPKAIEAYEDLLKEFPHSLLAEEARKRIRILRGDIL